MLTPARADFAGSEESSVPAPAASDPGASSAPGASEPSPASERPQRARMSDRIGTFEWRLESPPSLVASGLDELYGSPGEGAGGRAPWLGRVHPDDRAALELLLDEVVAGRAEYDTEYRVVRPDGGVRWIAARGRLEDGADDRPARLLGVHVDVTERRLAEAELAADVDALKRMHALSRHMVEEAEVGPLLQEMLDTAVALMRADKGTLQLLQGDALRIVVHHGHERPFLESFASAERVPSVCGEAMRCGERVVVPDVETSPLLAGTPSLAVVRAAGVRAVQSTPITSRSGRLLGILTTQWAVPHTPDEHSLWRLDLLARQAADLIEQKQAEEALRDAERRYRDLVRLAPTGIYEVDFRRQRLVSVNETILQVLGYGRDELLGMSPFDLMDEDSQSRFLERLQKWLSGERPEPEVEYRIRRKDGRYIDALLSATFTRDEDGLPLGATVVAHDITARKSAERALRESEERFRAFVTASSDAVYRISPDWSGMLALRERDFLADTADPSATWLEKCVPPEDRPAVGAAIQAAIREGTTFQLEHRVVRADGRRGWSIFRAVPLRDADGTIIEWFGAASDITERKRAEEALREANLALAAADRRKSDFLAMLSHELRNPLAPIASSLFVLDRVPPGSEEARRARTVIGRQVAHLVRLVDDLLDVTRIARGKLRIERESVELTDVVRRTVDDQGALFERAGVELDARLCAGPLPLAGDGTRLSQALGNLLQNAAKFTGRGGSARVTLTREGREAVVRVADTGVGITPEMLGRLFEPFAQADTTLDRSRGGLGLGLALVKAVVEMHGGTVAARSDGPGRGAEFTLRLPLEAVAGATSAPTADRPAATPLRVLLVEDNADAAESLRDALELAGHAVDVAGSGPEGIRLARAARPDVVVCDIGLPGMSGHEVARVIRADASLRGTFLVALTGYAAADDVAMALEAGFDRHLAKPPELSTLERLLAERTAARQA